MGANNFEIYVHSSYGTNSSTVQLVPGVPVLAFHYTAKITLPSTLIPSSFGPKNVGANVNQEGDARVSEGTTYIK